MTTALITPNSASSDDGAENRSGNSDVRYPYDFEKRMVTSPCCRVARPASLRTKPRRRPPASPSKPCSRSIVLQHGCVASSVPTSRTLLNGWNANDATKADVRKIKRGKGLVDSLAVEYLPRGRNTTWASNPSSLSGYICPAELRGGTVARGDVDVRRLRVGVVVAVSASRKGDVAAVNRRAARQFSWDEH